MKQLAYLDQQDLEEHPDQGHATKDWRHLAACRDKDPELFQPLAGQVAETAAAKAICGRCPVRLECLGRALDQGEQYGIWGGMTEEERRDLLRQMAKS